METKRIILLVVLIAITLACKTIQQNPSVNPAKTPLPTTNSANHPESTETEEESQIQPTPVAENKGQCDAEIFITSVTESSVENDTKVVEVTLGFKNTGSLWVQVSGPDGDWIVLQTDAPTYLTTTDESTYGYSGITTDIDLIRTPLLPPGFVTLGTILPQLPIFLYELTFLNIPTAKILDSITIGDMKITCPSPIGLRFLPAKTYKLSSDVTEPPAQESGGQYPDLASSTLHLPKGEGELMFTEVTRDGDAVTVTFSFTNLSSTEAPPPFRGYIIGDSRLSACIGLGLEVGFCQFTEFNTVPPGQTQTFSSTITVSQNDTNLKFVYLYSDVYGGFEEPNKVYMIHTE